MITMPEQTRVKAKRFKVVAIGVGCWGGGATEVEAIKNMGLAGGCRSKKLCIIFAAERPCLRGDGGELSMSPPDGGWPVDSCGSDHFAEVRETRIKGRKRVTGKYGEVEWPK